MPELPDLQVFSRNLTKALKDKKLQKIDVKVVQKLNVTEKELKDTLEGNSISKVIRVGKELHFEFENKHILGLHLMLHGQLFMYDKTNENKFTIVEMLFGDGTGLALTDFQKAATPTLDPADNSTPDALDFEDKYLADKLSSTKTPVKTVLMDQHVLRGIGNAYADEILYDAKLSPFSPSNKIPADKVKLLIKSIKSVLVDAEKHILKDHPDIISGEFRGFLKVHQPKRKETPSGETIHQKPVGSRKTYYTDSQELYS